MNEIVLLVEDEENDVFFMNRAWKQAGIANPLHVAEDGQAAIDYLRDAFGNDRLTVPRLVLLDLKLPQVMGLEVLKWIRQQPELQTLIVIVLTSSKLSSDIESAYQLGANSYLVKPTADKLLQIARLIKEYWLDLNQVASERSESSFEPSGKS
jgi:CheY-like chemotaxis protein